MNIYDGGPAFPGPDQRTLTDDIHEGMTLLDWFAGQAMRGLLAADGRSKFRDIAAQSYDMGDVMLAERRRRQHIWDVRQAAIKADLDDRIANDEIVD